MSEPVIWGPLTKAVDDLTTIIEEIAAKILTHNQDPSSHGQSGESIYAHRNEAILDHLLASVDLKHLVDDKIIYVSGFESLDGWQTGGTLTIAVLGTVVAAPAGQNNVGYIFQEGAPGASQIDWSKNPFFQATVKFVNSADQLAYVTRGAPLSEAAGNAFGFKVIDNAIYAYWSKDANEYTQVLAGVTITDSNVYRAFCDSTAEEIYFYVNGILKYTATTNYPNVTGETIFFLFIKNTAAASRSLIIVDLMMEQDR